MRLANIRLFSFNRTAAIVVASLVISAAVRAQPIDLDVGFGANGTVYAPVDAPNSTNRDRTVAVFPIDFADYLVVVESANASGGVSPTFVRVTSAGVQSRNTVNLNMVGITAACQDSATGRFVLGMRATSTFGNVIDFRKYDALGVQDMAFGSAGTGRFAYGANRFERGAELNCHNGRFAAGIWLGDTDGAWTGNRIVQGQLAGTDFSFSTINPPSDTLTIQTVGSGGTDDGEVIFANKLDEDNEPLSVEVLQYASTQLNTAPTIATIAIGDHCALGSTSTVEKAHVDNLGRVHVAGSSTIASGPFFDGTKFNWLMQFNVTDTGTTGPIRCGTRTFATFSGITPGTLNTVEAFEFSGQSIYLLTTFATGGLIPDRSTPRLLRFQDGTGGLVPDLSYLPSVIADFGNTTPMHRGRQLLFDTRPSVSRLVIAGNREFQGLDEDPFLVRMIAAPMFANGFE
ncbi:MAG: hypothetical protein IPK97_05965 [Ahniella sp.]|nr:hypothetical protein [Ahniella sp.]